MIEMIKEMVIKMRTVLDEIGKLKIYGDIEAGKKILACQTLLKLKKDIQHEEHASYGLNFDVLQAAFAPFKCGNKYTMPFVSVIDCHIAGTPYYEAADYIPKLLLNGSCTLRREPDNKYDRHAIEILGEGGVKLGYVPMAVNREVGMYLECGAPYDVSVKKYSVGEDNGEKYVRIRVSIEFICTEASNLEMTDKNDVIVPPDAEVFPNSLYVKDDRNNNTLHNR